MAAFRSRVGDAGTGGLRPAVVRLAAVVVLVAALVGASAAVLPRAEASTPGAAAMVLFYPAVVLVGITVIGIPVALALGVVYALARLGGYVVVASLVGRKVVPGRDQTDN